LAQELIDLLLCWHFGYAAMAAVQRRPLTWRATRLVVPCTQANPTVPLSILAFVLLMPSPPAALNAAMLTERRRAGDPWFASNGHEIALTFGEGAGETPAYADVPIEMPCLQEGRVGINIVKEKRIVSRVLYRDAFLAGWRVGDDIIKVNGRLVASNAAVQRAVKRAVAAYKRRGTPLRFVVRRWATRGTSSGVVHMSNGKGMEHLVPMLDLVRGLVKDYPVVVFLQNSNATMPFERLVTQKLVRLLDALGVAFKAANCADEHFNPGLRQAVLELSGEDSSLPQLFVGGAPVSSSTWQNTSNLRERLVEAGATFRRVQTSA